MSWTHWTRTELAAIRNADRFRRLIPFEPASGPAGSVRGRPVISFAANDYLGLSFHPRVLQAAHAAIDRYGASAGASRLVTGTRAVHCELESAIARWKGAELALVFPTGYAANLGVLTTFGVSGATIFSDALNHASIIDGCRLAKAQTRIYRHADTGHLQSLMQEASGAKIVVTDAVFSMDGDTAPLQELAALCREQGALLIIDEAHSVLDPSFAPPEGLELLRVGTLSKTLGSLGGWVAGPRPLIELLVNRARLFIYTTGLAPATAAAALAALEIYLGEEGDQLRARLRRYVERLKPGHPAPFVPFILGDERAALEASELLLGRGLYVPAIRPPTVPAGTARLRIALSAAHSDDMVQQLIRALAELPMRCAARDSACLDPPA